MKTFSYKMFFYDSPTISRSSENPTNGENKTDSSNLENNWKKFSFGNSKAAGGQTSRSASKLMSVRDLVPLSSVIQVDCIT